MPDGIRLDCKKCPSFCCKMAGRVEVSQRDVRRLARHLGITAREFAEKHVVARGRDGKGRIKIEWQTCQFLGEDHSCTVYAARPNDCRGYVCWDQPDKTVYEFASQTQLPIARLRRLERLGRNG
ncbi:MAG TPA: YkgJ family cysteine cluster protein [Candidatus Sulfotelmatobacter sp.]|nr:YkgJ family cysteine cluster protein [Candidatus Sulfotelmatobacter sp.]